MAETAEILGVAVKTAEEDWTYARPGSAAGGYASGEKLARLKKVTGGFRAVLAWDDEGPSDCERSPCRTARSSTRPSNCPRTSGPAFLDRACGANRDLRDEVEALLQAHDAPDSFLREPVDRTAAYEPTRRAAPARSSGRTSCWSRSARAASASSSWPSRPQPVRRKVALKVIKPGMDTRQVVARFEAERQALALMDHPNIAKVLDGGATAVGPPVLRDGAGQGRADHRVLRPEPR